jgi:hypothetical protein
MRTLCPLLCQVTAQGFILTCSSSINGEGVELELGKPNERFLLQCNFAAKTCRFTPKKESFAHCAKQQVIAFSHTLVMRI